MSKPNISVSKFFEDLVQDGKFDSRGGMSTGSPSPDPSMPDLSKMPPVNMGNLFESKSMPKPKSTSQSTSDIRKELFDLIQEAKAFMEKANKKLNEMCGVTAGSTTVGSIGVGPAKGFKAPKKNKKLVKKKLK